MVPHFIWLKRVNFLPLAYASDTYSISSHLQSLKLVLGYVGHNIALLALPLVIATAALVSSPRDWILLQRDPGAFVARSWSRDANPEVRIRQAWNIWIVQAIVAIGPPIGALAFSIYLKTDWGISLFFLTPLAVIAIPHLRVRRTVLARVTAAWLVISLMMLAAAPQLVAITMPRNAAGQFTYGSHSQLARELTDLWHQRFDSRWRVVAGATDVGAPMTFYSPDHPALLTPNEIWSSELTPLEDAKRYGFIGICEVGAWDQQECDAWMKRNAASGEEMPITTRRFFRGSASYTTAWSVYVVAPAKPN
jgi:hypothetical protein